MATCPPRNLMKTHELESNPYAYASRVEAEIANSDIHLISEQEEADQGGKVNCVGIQPVLPELATTSAQEGKPRSIT